jgi:hypothetical protein
MQLSAPSFRSRIEAGGEYRAEKVRSLGMDTSVITGKAADLRKRAVVSLPVKQRPVWQTALMWFAGGLLIATAVGFFFDANRGAARRRMAVDKAMAKGRDMTEWSGQKARHLRDMATGTVAEATSASSGGGY